MVVAVIGVRVSWPITNSAFAPPPTGGSVAESGALSWPLGRWGETSSDRKPRISISISPPVGATVSTRPSG